MDSQVSRCPLTWFAMWPKSVRERVTKTDSAQTKPPVLLNPANQVFFVVAAKWQPYRSHIQPSASLHRERPCCHDNTGGPWPSWNMQDTANWLCRVQLTNKTFCRYVDRSLNQHRVGWLPIDCHDGGSAVLQTGRLGVSAAFCLCQGRNVETGWANKSVNQTSGAQRGKRGEDWSRSGRHGQCSGLWNYKIKV